MANSSSTTVAAPGWRIALQAAVIAAAVFVIYGHVLQGDWLWDDEEDIIGNPITKSATGLWSIWFEPGSQLDYYPIKASVQWAQWQLWGADTFGYHLTNVLLHIVGALLVWRLLAKLGLKYGWLGGLLFAVHPANVESVAWITELKNTLSLPPFLLAMIFWIDYDERRRTRDYLLAATCFLVAMLCKTTMIMFPVVILLYAWWKRGRIGWRDLVTSAPFFAISLVLGLVTLYCEAWCMQAHNQPVWVVPIGGFFARLALAGTTLASYLAQSLWPVNLSPIYPLWQVNPPSLIEFLPWLILAGVLYACWRKRESWGRHFALALGFFVINLAPFLGFTANGFMRFSWVMDHFLYIPLISLIGLAAAGWGLLQERLPATGRSFASGGAALLLLALTWISYDYAGWFLDSETLWSHTVQRNPEAWPAYNNLAIQWANAGRYDDAAQAYEKALELHPDYPEAHHNLGAILVQAGHLDKAIGHYREALRLNPHYVSALNSLGSVLLMQGKIQEAREEYDQALLVSPDDAPTHDNLGSLLLQQGKIPDAIAQYQKAVELDPQRSLAHGNLANALLRANRPMEAIDQYDNAIRIGPDLPLLRNGLARALSDAGRRPEALQQCDEALRLDPHFGLAHATKGRVLSDMGNIPESIVELQMALQIDPHMDDGRQLLEQLQGSQKSAAKKSK
jgi:tetratricopeptide (TPR) repeat protein